LPAKELGSGDDRVVDPVTAGSQFPGAAQVVAPPSDRGMDEARGGESPGGGPGTRNRDRLENDHEADAASPIHRPAGRDWSRQKGRAMRINHQVVVFDAADLTAESSFWAGVLDGIVDTEDDWHMVIVEGEPRVGVQLAPDHVPPDWPDGTPPQQIHLDLWVEDFEAAHARVMSLGAKVLKPAEDVDSPDNFQVYADPAGHPFCLCWLTER